MGKYMKKPIIVDATQWFKNGDHPKDHSHIGKGPFSQQDLERYYDYTCQPGKIVRLPSEELMFQIDPGSKVCGKCGKTWGDHGECGTLEGLHIVCPGDWIITGVQGEHYPCKPDIFEATYYEVPEVTDAEKC